MNDLAEPDTPNEPGTSGSRRDWRFWVGGLGRILLVIGVLMFGFVAYQLWGTGIEYRQHQSTLAKEFAERQAELLGSNETSPDSTSPDSNDPTDATGTLVPPTTFPGTGNKRTQWPKPAPGDVIAIIAIPKVHKRVYAVAGVDTNDLKQGLGHYPKTPLPGQLGNSAFAGHRTTFGAPLFDIDKLSIGDEIVVDTITNQRYVYLVSSSPRVVAATAGSVVETTDRTVATLTLTSCHPKYSAKERIVVVATLDPSRSGVVEPPFVDPAPSTTAPSTTGSSGASTSVAGSSTTAVATTTTTTVDDAVPTVGPDAGNPGDEFPLGEDAPQLSRGWLTDSAAWWHVIGWGFLNAGVAAAGWLLARRTRRWWLGLAAAAAPFLLVLYFVYQNVNRLLPADL
ncbi:MAG: sortase [Actinomycetota bacterium]